MKHLTTEMKQQQDWRRNKVPELSSQGYSEREIADTIRVSDTTVHRDLVYLRQQAHENLQKRISEIIAGRVPAMYVWDKTKPKTDTGGSRKYSRSQGKTASQIHSQ